MLIRSSAVLLQLAFINHVLLDRHETITRQKRHLVYPKGGLFKLVLGIAIPVKLGARQSMACGWNLQFQYAVPTNVSQLKEYPPIITRSSRDKRAEAFFSDRQIAYMSVENIMNRHNLDGRSCLLRSICENAQHPLNQSENGLYGHLLHIFLTPNYSDGNPGVDPAYVVAEKSGTSGVDCALRYPDCDSGSGALDLISLVDY